MADYRAAAADAEIATDRDKIRENVFLEEIYVDVYERLLDAIPRKSFPKVLEIGSGGGFLQTCAPHITTSDCVPGDGIDRVVDACNLQASFSPNELDAIVAFNVFHHLPDVTAFLRGASSVLRTGGRIVLVEPWFTPLGQWFYRGLHHEPSILDPNDWSISGEGRLLGANSRLPTSVFRDSDARFRDSFPDLRIVSLTPFHKWLYLLSGGLRLNTRIPRSAARALLALDRRIQAGDEQTGLFARIIVEKK